MRDSHRLKEKYELSLDNRQIVSITIASLVALGGVFMLGVVVGKKLSAETAALAPPSTDLLGQLDRKPDALETVKADAALTFQDELTRKSPTLVAEPPIVRAVEPKPVEVKPSEPVVAVAPKPEPEPVKPPEPKHVEVAAAPKLEPVATRTVDGGGLKEAFGKAQQRPPTETAADGAWTLQLSAYQDKAEADRFAAGLRDKGYAPYIVEATIPGKGTWFRVRMGRFGTKDAASRYMDDFRRETSMNAIVTSN